MPTKITKKLADSLMSINKEARGINLKSDAEYILRVGGEKAIKKAESEFIKLGYPFKYKNVRAFGYYPMGIRMLSLLIIEKVFNLEDKDLKKVCGFPTYLAMISQLAKRLFASSESLGRIAEQAPKIWQQHFTGGNLKIVEYDLEKKYCIIRIWDLEAHPAFCPCLAGYFQTLGKTVTRSKELTCHETKCVYDGDEYHEFLVKWK